MHKYFAAANTADGFVSRFNDIFDPRRLERTYIIKGGSGTGKSTLMKKAASRALEKGGECEYYYCSSDPTSLDGVIMILPDGSRLAMLDGTAPHVHDPKFPGAAEEIVNLGEYWDDEILKRQREKIISLCEKKAQLFNEAYSSFSAAGALLSLQLRESENYLIKDKLSAAMERLLTQRMRECRVKSGKSHRQVRIISALSTLGEYHFDSFGDCESVCLVSDTAATGPHLFTSLIAVAEKLGLDYDIAPLPLMPHLTEAVRFPQLSLSVVSRTEKNDVKIINMARFVDSNILAGYDRAYLRLIKKNIRELTNYGLSKLSSVRKVHDDVEKIYIGAMDFPRLESAMELLITKMGI